MPATHTPYHTRPADAVAAGLGVDPAAGLSADDAARRLGEQGRNELTETGGRTVWGILYEQFAEAMVILLAAAALVSLLLGEYADAAVILLIVVLNAALGFFQDYRAEKAMAALKQLSVPTVRVRRGGQTTEVPAPEVVPGDVVLLEAGNLVPADGRLLSARNLRVEEAALTGESEPAEKFADTLDDPDAPLADRRNLAFSGTTVTYGRGELLVTGTGMDTELGRIAAMLQGVDDSQTPLQRRLARLGVQLAAAVAAIIAVVMGLELLRRPDVLEDFGFTREYLGRAGGDLKEIVQTALSMAVAAVPEGLPAVATICLALGARRMFKRHALIRRLPAVETLGSVTVICSDKTGTLTQNRMTVTVLDVLGERLEPDSADLTDRAEAALLLAGGDLCNDAELRHLPDGADAGDEPEVIGDPTEGALVVAAERAGLDRVKLAALFPRVTELPFDSDRKRMTTVHDIVREPGHSENPAEVALRSLPGGDAFEQVAFTKGAVDALLDVCERVWSEGAVHPLDDDWRERIERTNGELAADGKRVLGVAVRGYSAKEFTDGADAADAERDLTFVGLVGMIDPPRPEVADAIARCRTAGIRPVMITGDHPLTAGTIARELGLNETGEVVTGRELNAMSAEEFAETASTAAVFARVSPEHKLRIVEALRADGQVVAMTGDGVNDAPALKRADIGVAMGVTGTDVSKEAAEMVLTDDDFATLVAAVEEGRTVYDNVRKFLKYTLTSNAGEIWVMLVAPLVGLFSTVFAGTPLPLLPLQILWINLVTDGLPGLALAVEPGERDIMDRPPIDPAANLLGGRMWRHILWVGLSMGLISFFVGWAYWDGPGADDENVTRFRTVVFTVLTFSQMGHALAVRSDTRSLFSLGLRSNVLLLFAVALTFVLQLALLYVPWLADVFYVMPLGLADLAWCLAVSTAVFWLVELEKWVVRRRTASHV